MPAAADVRRKIPRPHQPGVVSQCRGHDPASAEAGLDHRCGHPFELTEDIRLPHDAAAQHHQSRVKSVDQGYDTTGEEVYRNNGLRIVAKTILEDSSEYSSDMYVLMLAENTSGRTLTIDDTYDSLSVNGYMTDYSFYSAELADGESAALEIRLQESSLEENQIASVSDISEIEVGFEIKADRDIIDEPTVLIQFDS